MTNKPENTALPKPKHDNFFSYSIHIPKVAKGFLKKHLPGELLSKINLESIGFEKTDFISKSLKKNISDCLIKVEVEQQEAYIYALIEHQSTNDRLMPFRMLQYMVPSLRGAFAIGKRRGNLLRLGEMSSRARNARPRGATSRFASCERSKF